MKRHICLTIGLFAAAAAAQNPPNVTITSLNLAKETNIDRIVRELKAAPRVGESDVFLFQEVARLSGNETVAAALAKRLGYSFAEVPSPPNVAPQGIAVVSRLPLSDPETTQLKLFDLKFHSRTRYALSAKVQTKAGPLRVWTVHLDTRINPDERIAQLSPVLEKLSVNEDSAIVGGDFNTTRFNWVKNVLPTPAATGHGRAVRTAFERIGFKSLLSDQQVTYSFLSQHLDWFFAKHVEIGGTGVVPIPFSDHHAVWAQLGTK